MEAREEFIHEWPENVDTPWKENWYFNFIDRKNRAFGVNHISLMRHTNKGRFSCVHVVDDMIYPYSRLIDIKDLKDLTDGTLKFEIVEPFKKFNVTFNGPRHKLNLNYEAIFPVYLYPKSKKAENKALAVDHYRQTCIAKGTVTVKGQSREIESCCDRDHTWGYRDEGNLTGWNWAGVYFADRSINFHRIMKGKDFYTAGYLSTKQGNTPLWRVSVENTAFDGDAPVSSVFTGFDDKDKPIARIKSEKFYQLRLPMVDKEGVTVFENFAQFTDLDTGEKCDGVDEYLINPKEKYY